MVSGIKITWIYFISVAYVILLGFGLYAENYLLLAFPIVLIILFGSVFYLDRVFLLIVFCAPLSINLEELDVDGIGLFLPTEPLLAAFSLLFIIREIHRGSFSKEILKHPITICIFLYLGWMLITSITSTRPLISIKYLIARLWFIIPCFYAGLIFFKKNNNYKKFLYYYSIALIIVVIYTVYNHYLLDFTEKTAHWVMSPFFKDHTSYGAAIAIFLPIAIGMLFTRGNSYTAKLFWSFALLVLIVGVILSYTRAAWLSLIGAFGLFIIIQFKLKLKHLAILAIPATIYLVNNYSDIFIDIQKNKTDSSDDLAEHVQSMSNISSDASNLERINRWKCAIAMFKEKPIQGWGPGTYSFEYGPFQERRDLTFISKFDGTGGNAHSEYLGALSESGLLGGLAFIALLIVVNVISIRLIQDLPRGTLRTLVFSSYLGLITYFMHGFLNNFLDTDKIAVPFWAFIAFIVLVDLHHKNKLSTNLPNSLTEES